MIDEILRSCQEHWHQVDPDHRFPREIRCVLQSRGRVVIFLFDASRRDHRPVGVVKVCRETKDSRHFIQAVALATHIRQALNDEVRATIPRMALIEPMEGAVASLEQALPGAPMKIPTGLLPMREHRRNTGAFKEWFLALNAQLLTGGPPEPSNSPPLETVIADNLAELSLPPECVRALTHAATHLAGTSLRATWRCGDLHHSNILMQRGRVSGVVDWEGTQYDPLGMSDWLQFAFQYLVDCYRQMLPGTPHIGLGKLAVDGLILPADSALTRLVSGETLGVLRASGFSPSDLQPMVTTFLTGLHWPWEKGQLLQHAAQILISG